MTARAGFTLALGSIVLAEIWDRGGHMVEWDEHLGEKPWDLTSPLNFEVTKRKKSIPRSVLSRADVHSGNCKAL